MNGQQSKLKSFESDLPTYTLAEAAELLHVHAQTLRNYQAEGLIKPGHVNGKLMFSDKDIKWIACLRSMIHEKKLSIPGLKKLLKLLPCWMVVSCPVEVHYECAAQVDWSLPRKPHLQGSATAPARDDAAPDRSAAAGSVCCGMR